MFYLIYKITDTINGMIYVGSHQTENIDDGYMGSGKYIKRAIRKHGSEHFIKEIIATYDSREEMIEAEAAIVNEAFVLDPSTYNLVIGGGGGHYYFNRDAAKQGRISADQTILARYGVSNIRCAPHIKAKRDEALLRLRESGYKNTFWLGKKHTSHAKQQIGEKNSVHQRGAGNSQYGTRWIHSLEERRNRKIPKYESLPEGWFEGRKMKF